MSQVQGRSGLQLPKLWEPSLQIILRMVHQHQQQQYHNNTTTTAFFRDTIQYCIFKLEKLDDSNKSHEFDKPDEFKDSNLLNLIEFGRVYFDFFVSTGSQI